MKRILWLNTVFLLVALLAACGGTAPSQTAPQATTAPAAAQPQAPTQAAQAPAQGAELYVFLPKSLDNPYWDAARKGMEARAKELGVQAEFLGPDTADAAKQVAI